MVKLYRLHLLFGLLIVGFSCSSQPSSPYAPESGTYTGGTLNVAGTMNYSYNPILGFGVQPGTSVTPGINVLGDLSLNNQGNNKGSYSFSKLKEWKGEWNYDPDKDQLHFTGPLKTALRYYHAGKGVYTLTLDIKSKPTDKEGVIYYFSKKASKEFPKRARPNGDISGIFTINPELNTTAFLDAASGSIKRSFASKTTITNYNHYSLGIGFTDNTKYYQLSVTDPSGNTRPYASSVIQSYGWEFYQYQYGVLSPDQRKVALLGRTPDSYLNLTYTPGYLAVGIFELTGRTLGIFRLEDNKFVIPAFLPDGRLLYCPQDGGMAITDASYRQSKKIYGNPINALAVSADGRQVVISEGVFFYTMNIDGSNRKQVICNGEPLEADDVNNVITLAWEPNGKHFAVSYKSGGKCSILVVPLDGSAYRFVKDEYGETIQQAGQLVSWH